MEERKPLPAKVKSARGTIGVSMREDQKATPEALPKERPRLQAPRQEAAQEKASQEKTDAIEEDESKEVGCEENEQREDSGDGKNGEEEEEDEGKKRKKGSKDEREANRKRGKKEVKDEEEKEEEYADAKRKAAIADFVAMRNDVIIKAAVTEAMSKGVQDQFV